MILEFNELKNQEKKKNTLLESLKKNYVELNTIISNEKSIEQLQQELLEEQNQQKQNNKLTNKIFHRKTYKINQKDYEQNRIRIEKEIKTQMNLKEQLEKIKKEINTETKELIKFGVLETEHIISLPDATPFTVNNDGVLQVNKNYKSNIIVKKMEDNDQLVLVHSTAFFPKNHTILSGYDGNKLDQKNTYNETQEIKYKGITKSFPNYSTRRTVHFILNDTVDSHGYGNWDNCPFVIIEPHNMHKEEMISITNTGDTWMQHSAKLSDKAILLMPNKFYRDLSDEEKKQYNIITYNQNENFTKKEATRIVLKSLGYNILWHDSQNAAHSYSTDAKLEDNLKNRNLELSFILNKNIHPKEDIYLSKEELLKFYQIDKENHTYDQSNNSQNPLGIDKHLTQILQKQNITPELFNFYVKYGLKFENNKYTSHSYHSIYNMYEIIKEKKFTEEMIHNFISDNKLQEIQNLIDKNKDYELDSVSIEQIINKNYSEINKFENLNEAKCLQEQLQNLFNNFSDKHEKQQMKVLSFLDDKIKFVYHSTTDNNFKINDGKFKFYDIKKVQDSSLYTKAFLLDTKGLKVKDIMNKLNNYITTINERNNQMNAMLQNNETNYIQDNIINKHF